jgi:ADP-ribosylglycohydrolase
MNDKAKAMVLASFVADSLALGAHWIYDTQEISRRFGRVDHLLSPLKESYHPTKQKGEFTHYGDQTLVLLESIEAGSGFDLDDFARRWQGLFKSYKGYIDRATKATLSNFAEGRNAEESGSPSADLAGASRIAPLIYRYYDDSTSLTSNARLQTAMTHNNPRVIEASEYFAQVASTVLQGSPPLTALKQVRDESFHSGPLARAVTEGISSVVSDTRNAIAHFGQSCEIGGALPATIHLIAKYEESPKEALIENVMAGGDSAARGMLVGMVLIAYHGIQALPSDWISSMKLRKTIEKLLENIDQQRKGRRDA